ncbi:ABC transporter permease [Ekhidna sp.]|uniref:ABC transporter permease n=1 Tax=Ekhidna sp. TaxID=2608089 RepID=UPI0032EFF542
MKNQPPKWISRFLKWYCDPNLLDEIQGDALELYNRRLGERSKRYADLLFIRDVLGYFRWTNIKKTTKIMNPLKNLILFQSFMKIGFRNIVKHYIINSISIIGLALSLGIGITALIFYDVQVNMDEFHVKGDRIYQITQLTEGSEIEGKTPVVLGPTIHDDNPAVQHFTRIERRGAYVKQRNNTFEEQIAFVDPAFLQVFDFPMIAGNKHSLSKKHSVVISYEMAKKYFANEDPIGKELQLMFTNDYEASFVVTGVMDKYADYASFYFDFYIPFANLFDFQQNENQWQATTDATFILTKPGISPGAITEGLQRYLEPVNAALASKPVVGFKLYPLFDLSEKCHEIAGSVSFTAPAFTRISLAIIALMLMALAVFNFINISIAAYSRRLREIAVRKVIGSNRRQIVLQFFTENLLLCLFSFLLGIYLSMAIFTPGLNYLIPLRIPSSFSSASFMLISLSSLFAGIVAIAGIYPSLYISRFSSSHILKGIAKFKRNSVFSRLMLAIQFVLAFITIVGCFVFTSHSLALYEKEWGYDAKDLLMIRTVSFAQMELMRNELLDDSKVNSIAVSMHSHVGVHNTTINYQYDHKTYESVGYYVDENYLSVLGLNLKSGRWFDGTGRDYEKSVVVNEAMVHSMNWEDPIGEKIDHQGTLREVIGVVSDFHYRSFHSTIRPVLFFGLDEDTPSSLYYLSIKSKPGAIHDLKLSSQLLWDDVVPGEPFVHMLQEEAFASFYEETEASTLILIVLSTIAIILACLGLFGLFSFSIQRRLKEFSIRKVLGATPLSIVTHVSKTYLVIIIIALVIGAPVGYLMIDKLLSIMYPEQMATGFSPFFLAFIMTLGTIGLTITGQIIRAVKVNPTENLRGE